jgi:hypothetical protein
MEHIYEEYMTELMNRYGQGNSLVTYEGYYATKTLRG